MAERGALLLLLKANECNFRNSELRAGMTAKGSRVAHPNALRYLRCMRPPPLKLGFSPDKGFVSIASGRASDDPMTIERNPDQFETPICLAA